MTELSRAVDAINSGEFRAFATKWLGFDPAEESGLTGVTIDLHVDEPARYVLHSLATKENDSD